MIFWQHILDKLKDNQKVYVLTVIESLRSSPGRKGFKMLVAEDGFIYGSIGGGVMEFSLVEGVKKLLKRKGEPPCFIKRQVHIKNVKEKSGMVCSGEQTIAHHGLEKHHAPVIEHIISCLQNGKKGTLSLAYNSFEFSYHEMTTQFEYQINSKKDWFFKELIGYKETLYIVGGGHVGVAVAELFVKLGFYVVILDNREKLNTLESCQAAHKKCTINYKDIEKQIEPLQTSYVVIMSNKYTDDKLVLKKLIEYPYKFLGILGSKAKLHKMWKELKAEGVSQEKLDSVYAPIGLSIKSETPDEIAVSIAAQIIQVRNKV